MKKKPSVSKRRVNRTRKFIARYKFLIVIAGSVIVAVFTIASLLMWSGNKGQEQAQLTSMKSEVQALTGVMPKYLRFNDISYCGQHKPRLFGDQITYTCTAVFGASVPVYSQEDVNKVVDEVYGGIATNINVNVTDDVGDVSYPTYSNDKNIFSSISHVSQEHLVGNVLFKLKNIKNEWCNSMFSLNLASEDSHVNLDIRLYCSVVVERPYWQPILDGKSD